MQDLAHSPSATRLVALIGNPNSGKTTLFNRLTGSHQKIANYPGATVEKVSGTMQVGEDSIECVDLPGLYSLNPVSIDEQLAVQAIAGSGIEGRKPELFVVVIDANNLERNLFFFSQVVELKHPLLVALTMTDLASRNGQVIDVPKLAQRLGVDVVPVVAHKNQGLDQLGRTLMWNLGLTAKSPEKQAEVLRLEIQTVWLWNELKSKGLESTRTQVRAAISGEQVPLLDKIKEQGLAALLEEAQQQTQGSRPTSIEKRYLWASDVRTTTVRQSEIGKGGRLSDRLDAFLTHRVWGLGVFVSVMYIMFQSIYTFAAPLMDGIGIGIDRLKSLISPSLDALPMVRSLIVDGVITGVGAVITFLPQILILFLFIAILEGSGYLARAAFLMDRLLGWCGLNGRAFVPLLSSFACAIPGIMSTRVMADPKSRLATTLVAPLMSCSARLPVYVLLIGSFIEPYFGAGWAGFSLFALHFLGLFVAIPIVWSLNKTILRGSRLPFLLELPPYQWPKFRDVIITMFQRGKVFVTTAGTIIIALSILVWALSYFPRSSQAEASYKADYSRLPAHLKRTISLENYLVEKQRENSYLGRFGKTVEPVFLPAGFDWRISTAIIAAFPAREFLVSALGIMFSQGDLVDESSPDLRSELKKATWPDGRPLFTPWTAIGLMVFFALCCQCMGTLAVIKRETNSWKWPVFVFTYMTLLAYFAAVGIHQLSKLFS